MVIPRRADEIMLPFITKRAQSAPSTSAMCAIIERRGQEVRRPFAGDVDRVRRVHCFQPVVQRAAARPHLGEHGVLPRHSLGVHGLQQAAGEARGGDDCGAPRREGVAGVVACDVFG